MANSKVFGKIKLPVKSSFLVDKTYSFFNSGLGHICFKPIINKLLWNSNKRVYVSCDYDSDSYSYFYRGSYFIHIGKLAVDRILSGANSSFNYTTREEFSEGFNACSRLMLGLFYHELGHIIFTDIAKLNDVMKNPYDDKHKTAYKVIFNVLEDPYVEACMKTTREGYRAKQCFDFMRPRFWDIDSYVDNNDFNSLHIFLLYRLRFGKMFTGTNEFFDTYSAELTPYISQFFAERDGGKRIDIAIAFVDKIEELGMDLTLQRTDEVKSSISSTPQVQGGTPGVPSKGISAPSPMQTSGQKSEEDGKDEEGEGDGDGDSENENENSPKTGGTGNNIGGGHSQKMIGSSHRNQKGGAINSMEELSGDVNDDEALFDGNEDDVELGSMTDDDYDFPSSDAFESYNLEDSINNPTVISRVSERPNPTAPVLVKGAEWYDGLCVKFDSVINDLMGAIDEFQTLHQVRKVGGFDSGSFHMKDFIKGSPIYECFARNIGEDFTPDLVVQILVDCSGSMDGEKSYICSQSLVCFVEALNRLGVPFQVSGFTTSYEEGVGCANSILMVKDFDDPLPDVRGFFAAFDSSNKRAFVQSYNGKAFEPLWNSNLDEIAIKVLHPMLMDRQERDKLLIVLSDGQTCGDSNALADVVKEVINDGVATFGVGICSNSVADYYPQHVILRSTSELDTLPEVFLNLLASIYMPE